MSLMVSGLYAGLTGLLFLVLAYRVVRLRRKLKIGLGSADNAALELAIRVHANLLENAPMALLLLMLAEANGLSQHYLHTLGSLWLVARLLHVIGLNLGRGGYHFGRFWGVLLTWTVILTLVVINLVISMATLA
ncbi:MAPEG family protein [Shewanella sp. AS16]|uniref:MAPEG family protein n=1 Tax=Shewanella sp. AS16 TaxID=2907625 RepID=UPI001F274DBA|nr:MAPEG family protein [Shewanella sp. AS16]MCE9686020.1 MAPEG family protein [Shewanella sp. AS16]